jgi:hypothetical protein
MSTWNLIKGTPESNRRRSERVMLRVRVKVRNEGAPRDTSFEEETDTLVVNAHGALILLASKVDKNQTLRLTNQGANKEQLCKVIYVAQKADGKAQVGIEFLTPSPAFWNISFPPSNWIDPELVPATEK